MPEGAPMALCGQQGCGAVVAANVAAERQRPRMYSTTAYWLGRLPGLIFLVVVLSIITLGSMVILPWFLDGLHASTPMAYLHTAFTVYLCVNVAWNYLVCLVAEPGYTRPFPTNVRPVDILGESVKMAQFCERCKAPKPFGASHCSTEGHCVMAMDHHCVMIGQCVGARNARFFFLLLLHIALSCAYIVLAVLYGVATFPSEADPVAVSLADHWFTRPSVNFFSGGNVLNATAAIAREAAARQERGMVVAFRLIARRFGWTSVFNHGPWGGVVIMWVWLVALAVLVGILFLFLNFIADLSRGETALQRWKRDRGLPSIPNGSADGSPADAALNDGSWAGFFTDLRRGLSQLFGGEPWYTAWVPRRPVPRPADSSEEWKQLAARHFTFPHPTMLS